MKLFTKTFRSIEGWEHTKIGGNDFYFLLDIGRLPVKRTFVLKEVLNEIELRISYFDLDVLIELLKEAIQSNNLVLAGHYLTILDNHRSLHGEYKTYFKLGNCCILINNEDPDFFETKHNDLKWKLYNSDDNVRAFFLGCSQRLLNSLSMSPTTSLTVDYFKSRKYRVSEMIFSNSIRSNREKDFQNWISGGYHSEKL